MLLLPAALQASQQRLDVAYINGVIWTGVRGVPQVAALGTIGNRIAAVGAEGDKHVEGVLVEERDVVQIGRLHSARARGEDNAEDLARDGG